jgi:N-acetylmuramate 1-kinase
VLGSVGKFVHDAMMTALGPLHLTIALADEAATARLAEDVAACLASGDVVTLSGGLGVGKTTFARALIRALADDRELEVPSPTFTLAQGYAMGRLPVTHFDLYRLAAADELDEIGLDESLTTGAALVEWPERAETRLPAERLDIAFAITGDGRTAVLSGNGAWRTRIAHSLAVRAFLDRTGWTRAGRRHLQGDASTRTFERVRAGERSAVLMDWPHREAPPDDRRQVFRARDARAFVAVDTALVDAGFSAPQIFASDLDHGLVLMEDFGTAGVLDAAGAPEPERYRAVIDLLAAIHARPRPGMLPLPDGATHRLPQLSAEVLAADIAFFADWYLPHAGERPDGAAMADFRAIWDELFARLAGAEQSWVLFDVQSPNLFWLPDRDGVARIGLIDFQDMFLGPAAYDVASICQDMRATVPAALEAALRDRYVATRRAADPGFDADAFATAYAILATARGLKSLGVFARLVDRFGKGDYLRHMPRVREYLERSLAHPALSGYADWHRRHLPPAT